ncbi:MAG: hypothetical protein HY685_04610 [Chloroflexi bacterium]|nr:hypothetical protein [Chloroflexota bacterium]
MGTPKVYWEDVKVGQQIPPFVRRTDFMNWNRYAAVNEEFVYIHMDDEGGRGAGQKAAFGMGNLRLSYAHNLLRDWIGEEGDIKHISIQYRGFNFKNDVLTTRGVVTDKRVEGDKHLVDLDLSVVNQEGVNNAPGRATVVLPSRGK